MLLNVVYVERVLQEIGRKPWYCCLSLSHQHPGRVDQHNLSLVCDTLEVSLFLLGITVQLAEIITDVVRVLDSQLMQQPIDLFLVCLIHLQRLM